MKVMTIAMAVAVSSLSLAAYANDAKNVSADAQQTVIGQSIEGSFSSQVPVGVTAVNVNGITGTTGRARGITGTTGRVHGITGTTGRAHGITGTTGRVHGITGTTGRARGITGTTGRVHGITGTTGRAH